MSKSAAESNETRVAELKAKLEADEAEQAAGKAASAKLFDPAEVLASAKRVRTLVDPVLGKVRYGVLTKAEVETLQKEEADNTRRAYKMIFTMLRKGYPDLRLEDLDEWPFETVTRLSELLSERFTSFLLLTPKKSPVG